MSSFANAYYDCPRRECKSDATESSSDSIEVSIVFRGIACHGGVATMAFDISDNEM